MVIKRKPSAVKKKSKQEAFIQGAPDAQNAAHKTGVYEKGVPKGNKRQISLTIAPDLLRKIDEVAQRTGQARAAIINMAVFQAIEGDIFNS